MGSGSTGKAAVLEAFGLPTSPRRSRLGFPHVGEFIRPLAAYLLVEIMWVIRTFDEAGLKVFVFQTITDIGPFWGIAPVNALKPRCSVKYRHQK
jgi:hypothetical protein